MFRRSVQERHKKIFPTDEEDMKRILQTVGRSLTLNFETKIGNLLIEENPLLLGIFLNTYLPLIIVYSIKSLLISIMMKNISPVFFPQSRG